MLGAGAPRRKLYGGGWRFLDGSWRRAAALGRYVVARALHAHPRPLPSCSFALPEFAFSLPRGRTYYWFDYSRFPSVTTVGSLGELHAAYPPPSLEFWIVLGILAGGGWVGRGGPLCRTLS